MTQKRVFWRASGVYIVRDLINAQQIAANSRASSSTRWKAVTPPYRQQYHQCTLSHCCLLIILVCSHHLLSLMSSYGSTDDTSNACTHVHTKRNVMVVQL
jgi:hypothetical protein